MAGYVALGKYSNEFEDALHFLCTSGWSNGDFGSVEAPTGFVWKISNTDEDVSMGNGEFTSLMESWFEQNNMEDSEEFRAGLVGDFIIREDNNGLIFLTTYESKELRDDAFNGLRDEFEKWDSQDKNEEFNVYWDDEQPDQWTEPEARIQPYGEDTCRIIDLEQGGVIAYCHRNNADRIVMALRAAEQDEDDDHDVPSRIQEEHDYKFGPDRL